MTRREKFLITCWAVLGVISLWGRVHAASGDISGSQSQDTRYYADQQVAAFRAGIAVADSMTTAAILGITEFKVGGRPTLSLGARFSEASRTCQVQIVYVYKSDPNATAVDQTKNYIKGYSPIVTLTAGSTLMEGSYYVAPQYYFDTDRSITLRILVVTKPASGTVDFWAGS